MEIERYNQETQCPLRLLSIDGGGIRGISILIILDEIMHRVQRAKHLDHTPLPADYFDFICGTSTGGIIAILLGRLRLSVPEAINTYRLFAKEVFSDRKPKGSDGTFKASTLEKVLKGVIGAKLGDREERMFVSQGSTEACKTFVCAVAAHHINGPPRLFRTWSADRNPGYNCAIWEAARATSAAPTFFKRILIGEPGLQEEFIDAGLGCNNPVKQLMQEAVREFGTERYVGCILSIGTGKPDVTGLKQPGPFQRLLPSDLIKVLQDIATDSEAVATELEERYRNRSGLYHRLNVDRGLEDVALDEWERLGEVKTHTTAYLNGHNVSREIDEIVKALIGGSARTFTLGQLDGSTLVSSSSITFYQYPNFKVNHFVAREDPLNEIQQHHQSHERAVAAKVVVFQGMGGCGKSQLALEYCERAQSDRRFGAIFWIDATSPKTVAQSYTLLAETILKVKTDGANEETNIRAVLQAMGTWTMPWLLVFDNFDEPKAFDKRPIKDFFPRGEAGSILVTSRHAASKALGHIITVTNMLEKEALELLFRRSGYERQNDENVAEGMMVVKRLGYFALAIDQAGAYISARCIGFHLFMDHYNNRREKVLKEIPDLWDYRRKKNETEAEQLLSVATTWELSYEQIRGDKDTRERKELILNLAAFFDNKSISEELFETDCGIQGEEVARSVGINVPVWDKYEFLDMIAELHNLSLIQSLDGKATIVSFTLHPVVQDLIILRLSSDARHMLTVIATMILSEYVKTQGARTTTFLEKQTVLSHLTSALDNDKNYLRQGTSLGQGHLKIPAVHFAVFCYVQGRYNEAYALSGKALLEPDNEPGLEHSDILLMAHIQADFHARQGDYFRAETLYNQTLMTQREKLGTNHPDILMSTGRLALLYRDWGRYCEAETLLKEALTSLKKQLGPDDHDTLLTAQHLASVYEVQGQYNEAEMLYKEVLTAMEKEPKSEYQSIDISILISDLQRIYIQQRRYDEAESILTLSLRDQEIQLGPEHMCIPETYYDLGRLYQCQHRHDEAEKFYERALRGVEKLFGPEHIRTQLTMSRLLENRKILQVESILQDWRNLSQLQSETLQFQLEILQTKSEILQEEYNFHQIKSELLQTKRELLQTKSKLLQAEHNHSVATFFKLCS